jgi:hypothetical protein
MTMKIMGGPAKEIIDQIEFDEKENFTPRQIEKFKNDPAFYRKFVKTVERDLSGAFAVVSTTRFELHYRMTTHTNRRT